MAELILALCTSEERDCPGLAWKQVDGLEAEQRFECSQYLHEQRYLLLSNYCDVQFNDSASKYTQSVNSPLLFCKLEFPSDPRHLH